MFALTEFSQTTQRAACLLLSLSSFPSPWPWARSKRSPRCTTATR